MKNRYFHAGSKYLYKKLEKLKNKNNQIERKNIRLSKEIERMKIDFITVIGIFVSIFTFISIEIQILRYVCDFFRIAGFSLIIFGSLSGFIILLHSIFSEKKVKRNIWCLFIFPFILGISLGSVPYMFEINNSCIISEKNISEIEYRLQKLENQNNN